MGNLNADNSFEDIKEGISKFFKKEGLVIQDVRLGGSKWVHFYLSLRQVSCVFLNCSCFCVHVGINATWQSYLFSVWQFLGLGEMTILMSWWIVTIHLRYCSLFFFLLFCTFFFLTNPFWREFDGNLYWIFTILKCIFYVFELYLLKYCQNHWIMLIWA